MYEQRLYEVWVLNMKRTLTALTVAATMFASSASALDPADLQKLKDTGNCAKCDLRDADLNGAYLRSADFSDADLGEADLRGAYLEQADFKGADLKDADLRGANLNGANLNGANLNGAALKYAAMIGAILCNTTMPDGSVIYSGC